MFSNKDPDDIVPRSRELAKALHAGQLDKGGAPYFEHLEAVAALLLRDNSRVPAFVIAAAYLHDALEDTAATPESLEAAGMPDRTIHLVKALTRPPGKPYLDWIHELAASGDEYAIQIKLADNRHNSDPSRYLRGSDMIEIRYTPARAILEHALWNTQFEWESDPARPMHRVELPEHIQQALDAAAAKYKPPSVL